MNNLPEALKELAARSRRREQEKFSQWVQLGGQSKPETKTKEGRAAWSRLHELYEFCKWVQARNASISEPSTVGIVAADGPEERRYEPDGGLTIEQWPYLKACCGEEDEDFTRICRDDIVEAILTNQLQKKGHSFGAASSAVDKLARQRDESGCGPLWAVIEEVPFDGVIRSLDKNATSISEELREYRRKQESKSHPLPDGPDEWNRTFLYRGKPSHRLSAREYRVVSALWAATGHSLPLEEVLLVGWSIRAAAIDGDYPHRVREFGRRLAQKIDNITLSVTKDPNQIGVHHRVTLTIL